MEEHKELIHHNELSSDTKKSMKSRILVGVILFITLVPLFILGDYFFFALILFICGVSTYEIIKAPQNETKKYDSWVYIITYFVIFGSLLLLLISNNYNSGQILYNLINGFSHVEISLSIGTLIILPYLILTIFDKKFSITDALYFICFDVILILGFSSLLFLRYAPINDFIKSNGTSEIGLSVRFGSSISLLLYLLIGVCFNDIFAYFTGVLFGKHKMCPDISPKKTWEGFIGGVIFSFIFSFLFAFLLAYFDYPIVSCLTLSKTYNIVIISFIMPLIATLGDLVFSSIKRHYNVKDFGTLLKSHGGALDRLDSILISSIVISCVIHLMTLSL